MRQFHNELAVPIDRELEVIGFVQNGTGIDVEVSDELNGVANEQHDENEYDLSSRSIVEGVLGQLLDL